MRRFRDRTLSAAFAKLFLGLRASASAALERRGAPPLALSRFDLHHGHLLAFPARPSAAAGGVAAPFSGVAFLAHAREYPAYDEKAFPVQLGFCQARGPVCTEAAKGYASAERLLSTPAEPLFPPPRPARADGL